VLDTPYVAVLRSHRVPRLLGAALFGRLTTGMAPLAIVLLVRHAGDSYTLAGLLSGGYAIAMAASAPAIGRLVDYRGQFGALLVSATAGVVAFVGLAYTIGRGTAAPLACALVAGAATPPLEPCLRALWPRLVRGGPSVDVAYALEAAVQELIFVTGPLLVVLLVAVADPRAAVVAAGLVALAGAVVFATTEESRDWTGDPREAHWAGPMRSAAIRTVLLGILSIGMAVGVGTVTIPAYAESVGTKAAAGWLLALWALGSLAGGLYYGARQWRSHAGLRYAALLGLLALSHIPLIGTPPLAVMVFLVALSGVMMAPAASCAFILVGKHSPDGTVTEAFAWLITSFLIGSSLGSVVAGPTVESRGVGTSFVLAVVAAGTGAVVVLLRRDSLS
jgi:MFS family permease